MEDITYRTMMGEYIIYYHGKIVGGIYDGRFLVKPIRSAIEYMPNAEYELPYDGAKEMLLVDDVDNKVNTASGASDPPVASSCFMRGINDFPSSLYALNRLSTSSWPNE